ncbi:hypothetical protein RJ640_017842 [Escallonia rubra]|uniref:F-box domain-containing protein n=1 Tax=Escallonia rubra TaxID=112253 RepID=A0AA88RQY0_9ASTE|nr:hypothetical protein RJ640_017842 [Escallonia rubra]
MVSQGGVRGSVVREGSNEYNHLGPPGRVFQHRLPESSPDVRLYSCNEFPQRDVAVASSVKTVLVLPVFKPSSGGRCVGVVEVIGTDESCSTATWDADRCLQVCLSAQCTHMGLEASEQQFIWVVRRGNEEEEEKWLPGGFEETVANYRERENLPRDSSIHSLAASGLQADQSKSFGSMNMDELLKNIYADSDAFPSPAAGDGGNRMVDEVWKEIVARRGGGGGGGGSQESEMTLEDFLTKARACQQKELVLNVLKHLIRLEVEVIEFLLAQSPMLELMLIQHKEDLMQMWRYCSQRVDAEYTFISKSMATTGHRKSKAMKSVEADIISNLPRNIIQNILKRMPIQDAVRTSILSRKWKYNCLFPPVTFEGFPNLINLELHSVVLPTDLFRGFLSSCPRLERLIVEICIAADQLYIHSPTLRHLHVSGSLRFINIENAQGLITLTISSRLALRNPEHITSSNMIQLLGRLPNLEKLSLDDFLHKYLAAGDVPKRLPAALNCLKTLTLSDMDFRNSYGEIYSALCLIRSSPNLQELEISAFNNDHSAVSDPGMNFWEEKCTISQLRTAKFTSFEGLTTELELIKYILACSPSLEKVYVEREKVADARAGLMTGFMISKELMRFHRASPKAEVVYSDPSEAMFA